MLLFRYNNTLLNSQLIKLQKKQENSENKRQKRLEAKEASLNSFQQVCIKLGYSKTVLDPESDKYALWTDCLRNLQVSSSQVHSLV